MMNTNSLLDKNSRYACGGTTEREDIGLGWWERKQYRFSETDTMITVTGKHVHRIDLLAYDFLGNSKLWWVIAQYNSIIDPHSEIVEGKYLRIPSTAAIQLMIAPKTGGIASQREITTAFITPII
jgi:hypothetical protein